jgi:hypothetical protein
MRRCLPEQMLTDHQGTGAVGCLFYLLVLAVLVLVGVRVLPVYYAYTTFESDIKTEISRAGARFYDDDLIIRDVLDLARKNEINVARDDVTVERAGGQIQLTVHSVEPVDFLVYQHTLVFDIKASSFIGHL